MASFSSWMKTQEAARPPASAPGAAPSEATKACRPNTPDLNQAAGSSKPPPPPPQQGPARAPTAKAHQKPAAPAAANPPAAPPALGNRMRLPAPPAVPSGPAQPWLLVRPTDGLGNRMRLVVAGLRLAEKHGRRLCVEWRATPDCNCAFRDLFAPHPRIALYEDAHASEPALRAAAALLDGRVDYGMWVWRKRSRHARTPWDKYRPDTQEEYAAVRRAYRDNLLRERASGTADVIEIHQDRWPEWDREMALCFDARPRTACIAVESCMEIYPAAEAVRGGRGDRLVRGALFKSLRPSAEVAALVAAAAPGQPYVAVHVRRRDNGAARLHSPTKLFTAHMDAHAKAGTNCFFLATDDADVEAELRARYGAGVVRVYRKRSRDRDVKEAIQDALVDLLLLSGGRKLLASHWSSFSATAGLVGLSAGLKEKVMWRPESEITLAEKRWMFE